MASDLKKKAISSLIWRFLERCGAQGVSFIVSIVLARLLEPEVYGTIALISVFTAILQVFVDSGMANALIQKKDADELDFSSVFFFNLTMCLALYLAVSCMRAGIWDRHLKPNGKTNFLVSLGAAVVFGAVFAVVNYFNFHEWQAALITFFLIAILLFVTIFAALSLSVFLYKKQVKALEEAPEE